MTYRDGRDPVITGVGLITPAGITRETAWERMRDGESCLDEPNRVDAAAMSQHSAYVTGEVEGFDPADYPAVDPRSMGRYSAFAIAATVQALDDAGLDPEGKTWDDERTGVSVASLCGGLDEILDAKESDAPKVSPYFPNRSLVNLAAGHVSIFTGAAGPNRTPASACAAGTHAIDGAVTDIMRDRADVMLVGGTESVMNYTGVALTAAPRAYSSRKSHDAARPFDETRDGMVLGEGAAMLVVEAEEHARRRGADRYARITGLGLTADGHHPVSPPKDGAGLKRSIDMALGDANVNPGAVDYVHAHGTATKAGDLAEARAIEGVLTAEIPVTSVKGGIGHTYGAGGAINVAVGALSIRDGCIPATANFDTPDPEIAVPVVPTPREHDVSCLVSNCAGFGGTNASVVLER